MDIKFESSPSFTLNQLEYESLWNSYGKKIQAAFKEVTTLPFQEEFITGVVGDYKSNFAGRSLNDPMLFRFSVRHKLGTIMHELSHRFLLEYQFNYNGILDNDHEVIDLFLPEVIEICFGKAASEERINYECTFPEVEIPNAWNKMLKYSFETRQQIWKKILQNTL